MQSSQAPHEEISRAMQAIASMRNATSLEEFDEHWKHFLHRLERIWSKTSAHYKRSPKWGNWAAKIDRDRRQDSLLSYLCNARGAEEHTTADVTGKEPGHVGINLADGVGVQPDGSVFIANISIKSGPNGMSIESAQPLKITFTPGKVRMEPVVNRGRTYAVPTLHQDKPIDSTDLPRAAELALSYYEAALSEAEQYFVK